MSTEINVGGHLYYVEDDLAAVHNLIQGETEKIDAFGFCPLLQTNGRTLWVRGFDISAFAEAEQQTPIYVDPALEEQRRALGDEWTTIDNPAQGQEEVPE